MNKLIVLLLLAAGSVGAGVNKPFPARWGEPPRIQTMDMVPLPDGFGTGSSTLRHWIAQNLQKDNAAGTNVTATASNALPVLPAVFEQNFDKLPVGPLPEGAFLILAGDFAVSEESSARFMELPGAPLDTFSVMFGPSQGADATVSARIFGTTKSRRQPTFAVGLGGASPWKLVVAPGKGAVELWKDDQFKTSVPWTWKSGAWTQLRLELRKVKDGEWLLRGKAWEASAPEPADWTIQTLTDETPPVGRASVWGSPFAGTPIRYDDLIVRGAAAK